MGILAVIESHNRLLPLPLPPPPPLSHSSPASSLSAPDSPAFDSCSSSSSSFSGSLTRRYHGGDAAAKEADRVGWRPLAFAPPSPPMSQYDTPAAAPPPDSRGNSEWEQPPPPPPPPLVKPRLPSISSLFSTVSAPEDERRRPDPFSAPVPPGPSSASLSSSSFFPRPLSQTRAAQQYGYPSPLPPPPPPPPKFGIGRPSPIFSGRPVPGTAATALPTPTTALSPPPDFFQPLPSPRHGSADRPLLFGLQERAVPPRQLLPSPTPPTPFTTTSQDRGDSRMPVSLGQVPPLPPPPPPPPPTTKDGLGPKIWTGTHFLPRYLHQAEVKDEGLCYFYDDGSYCRSVIDGERVNAHWGVTKAGKPRKRLAIACITCREKKIKCDPDFPRCAQCEKFGRTCRFKNAPRGSQHGISPSSPPTETDVGVRRSGGVSGDGSGSGGGGSGGGGGGPADPISPPAFASNTVSISPCATTRTMSPIRPEMPISKRPRLLSYDPSEREPPRSVTLPRLLDAPRRPVILEDEAGPGTRPRPSPGWQSTVMTMELPRIRESALRRPWEEEGGGGGSAPSSPSGGAAGAHRSRRAESQKRPLGGD